MYPWPDPEGFTRYPDTDLPATLIYYIEDPGLMISESITMTKVPGQYKYTGTSTTVFGTAVAIIPGVGVDAGKWGISVGDTGIIDYFIGPCLVTYRGETPFSGAVEDEFPDTLTLEHPDIPTSCELLRVSLCCWEGVWEYPHPGFPTETIIEPIGLCYDPTDLAWGFGSYLTGYIYIKDDPQSGPQGIYRFEGHGEEEYIVS
jgi:hypothetical protein